ncbi:MAG: acyl-[acyl-carrier-protein] thioesterase, partial [Prevotella salivae]|nr:acyl-[acyl-carrier-protein] thioesterase [Segatella salivae]
MKDEILGAVGRYAFQAEPFHCDNSYHLFLPHLCNQLLNAADLHSNERGYGVRVLSNLHKTWVLSRFTLEIYHLPEVYESFTIETWVNSVMRYFTSRNFSISDARGKVCAYARSVWALIDTDTRQPVDILKVNDGQIMKYVEKDKC